MEKRSSGEEERRSGEVIGFVSHNGGAAGGKSEIGISKSETNRKFEIS